MVNTKEIESIESLKAIRDSVQGDDLCKVPLFHGTRRYALQAPETERRQFYSACDRVILFARELLASEKIDENTIDAYQRSGHPSFLSMVVHRKGRPDFEYGDFYLTSGYATAIDFAHNAGGELGEHAYRQCEGFRDLGIAPGEDVQSAAKIVVDEYEKYRDSEKILLVYCGIKFTDLYNEKTGSPFCFPVKSEKDAELMRIKITNLYKSKETDTSASSRNFRLADPNAYTAYVLREIDFRKGFSVFTDIRDVDRLIGERKWTF